MAGMRIQYRTYRGNLHEATCWVTLIAVLDFLGMAAQFALGLVFLLGMSFLGSIVSKNLAQNPQFSGVNVMGVLAASGVVIAVGFFIFAVIAALLGWGLLKLKNW